MNARDVECPTCGAEAGRPCRSLTTGRSNTDTHKARRDLAWEIERLEGPEYVVTFGELFAGYGGLGMGVAAGLGMPSRMAWCAEFEAAPSKILAHRFPGVPNLGDVTKIDWHSVEPVDVITGGSPCQDLSHAGKRRGMKPGTRSGLWASMCDAIEIIRPSLVVWENVKGALSAEASSDLESCPGCVGDLEDGAALRALGRVLGDLAELGFDAWWYGLRAADVGAAHGRWREFVLAVPAETVLHPGHDARGTEREREPQEQATGAGRARAASPIVARALAALSGGGGPRPATDVLSLLPTPAVNDMGAAYTPEEWDEWTAEQKAAHHNGNGHGKSLAVEAKRLLPTPDAYAGSRGGSQHPVKRAEGGHSISLADVTEHSLLLPTPTAMMPERDSKGRRELRAAGKTKTGPGLSEAVHDRLLPTPLADGMESVTRADFRPSLRDALLPTPLLSDTSGPIDPAHRRDRGMPEQLSDVTRLLPTPKATNNENEPGRDPETGDEFSLNLGQTIKRQEWREYAPAIERWEAVTGRPAPSPLEWSWEFRRRQRGEDPRPAGRRGSIARLRRLSPAFVEWLMGLPEGWVTDPAIGISRADQLKALGNGVVPQQAAAATRAFLEDLAEALAEQEQSA